MARISTYAIDGTPVSSDKVIGTDSSGTTTKNYPLGSVSDWLKESGASAVLGQNNYSFQIALDPDAGRLPGSFSFENYGGDGTEFINVSRLTISKSSSTGKYVGDYLLSTVGDRVMLGQLDDLNSFGVYTLVSLVQNSIEPTFYDAELLFVEGNGALQGNKSYGLATYSASASAGSAVWGSIEGTVTNQTDLVDYIDAEIAAIPTPATPTLQSVTDEGNTTTNNIGIGTSSPSYPLHVVGNSLVTGTQFIGDTFTRIQQGSGNLILSNLSSNGSVVLRTNSVEQMRLTSAGRVGIGTTNPISKLELQDGTFTVDNGNIDVFFGGISIDRNSANNTALKVNQRGTADIFALQDDGTDVLTIIDGGNVGIGTTEPGSTLPSDAESGSKILQLTGVSGSAGDTAILLRSLDNSSGFDLWHNASSGDSYIDNRYFYGDTIFRVRTASTPNEVVRITPDGNVGIGTTAPGYPLHIVASNNSTVLGLDAGSNARFRFAGNSTSGYTSTFNIDDTGLDIGHDSTARSLNLKTGNQDRLTILGSGNVGIGTTAPAAKLDINAANTESAFKILQPYAGDANADYIGELTINSTSRGGLKVEGKGQTTNSNAPLMLYGNDTADGGTARVVIKANTNSATRTVMSVRNSSNSDLLVVRGGGNVGIGTTAPQSKFVIGAQAGTIATLADFRGASDNDFIQVARTTDTARGVKIFSSGRINASSTHISEAAYLFNNTSTNTITTGDREFFQINGDWSPSSGTSTWAQTLLTPTINTTGTYAGVVRGIYYNPTVTSALGTHRAIETTAGDVIFRGGNVGIGTTAPADYYSNKLVVSAEDESGITLAATTNSAVNHIMFADGTTGTEAYRGYLSYNHLDDSMRIGVGSTERMRIGVNGAVAVGSTNTATGYALYVAGNVGVSGLATTSDITLGENRAIRNLGSTIIDIDSNNNGTADYFAVTKGGYVSSTTLLKVEQDGDVIVPIGNVGIGTTAPTEKLDVVGDIASQGIYVDRTHESDGIGSPFATLGLHRFYGNANTLYIGKSNVSGTYIALVTQNADLELASTNGRVYLRSAGQQLLAQEDALSLGIIQHNAANNNYGKYISVTNSTNATGVRGRVDINGDLRIVDYSTSSPIEKTKIKNDGSAYFSGNVGIGTTAPSEKLHVAGNAKVDGTLVIDNTKITDTNGQVYIDNLTNGGDLFIRTRDDQGGVDTGILLNGTDKTVSLHYNTLAKLITASDGVSVTGNINLSAGSYLKSSTRTNILLDRPADARMVFNTLYQSSTTGGYEFTTGSTSRMVIAGDGNVGIGTTAPASDFSVAGRADISSRLRVGVAGNPNKTLEVWGDHISVTSGGVIWAIFDQSAEKAGIGTSTPDSKLHVKATSGIAFKVDPNSADKEWYIDTTNPDHLKKEGNLILNADPTNVHASTKISFNIDGSNKASINSDGDLGVGTTAQTSKLHVDGTAMRQLRIGTAGGPSSNTDTSGAEGDIAYDDLYLYIKTGSGWGRVALDFAF